MESTEAKKQEAEEQPLKQNDLTKLENKSCIEKLRYIKSNITVEPIFAGLIIASTISRLAVQNLNLDKACRVKLDYGEEVCASLLDKKGNLTDHEGEVQKIISSIESWKSIIQTAIPTLLVIFMGAWSDRTGNRKLCILMPILGEFLVSISNIISTVFFYEIGIEITMFLEAFFSAITGGWVMVYLGVFSYISDITSESTRTFRVGMANLCMTAGVPVGTALSGVLLKWLGYFGVFTISSSIYLLTFSYGLFTLKTISKPSAGDEKPKPVTCKELAMLVKETADVATQKRTNNQRMKIILTLSVVAIIYGPNHGERLLSYMFVRYRLKWDAVKYSIYTTYSVITHCTGALFSISLFSKRWGFHDSMLCLISITSKLVGSIYLNFVHTDLQMYMVPLVEILNATTFTSLRSMASKLVPSEEMGAWVGTTILPILTAIIITWKRGCVPDKGKDQSVKLQEHSFGYTITYRQVRLKSHTGLVTYNRKKPSKMNSLFSLVETLAALVFDPVYSLLYARTVAVFTGAAYLFSACMTLPAIAILVWFFVQHRRESKDRSAIIDKQEEKERNVQHTSGKIQGLGKPGLTI